MTSYSKKVTVTSFLIFSRDLKVGDTGADVMALQRLLNESEGTTVAKSGPGSRGQETSYFGPATRSAVARFQQKYSKEVLYPAGLIVPSGIVGKLTRQKMNELMGAKNLVVIGQSVSSSSSSFISTTTKSKIIPVVSGVLPTVVQPDGMVTISGSNFDRYSNTVKLKYGILEQIIQNVPSRDGKTLIVQYSAPGPSSVDLNQIKATPGDILAAVQESIKGKNFPMDRLTNPYKGIHNLSELDAIMKKSGHSIADLQDPYMVIVSNANGISKQTNIIVKGMRRITFDAN
jgi:peptidoglycan hydrolase-like protein with peptidoglycan-binding domain